MGLRLSKVIIILSVLALLLTVSVGCGLTSKKDTPNDIAKNSTSEFKGNTNHFQDKNLTQNLLKEKGVLDGQVYIKDDYAIGTFTVKNTVTDAQAKEIANKYAQLLKTTYKGKNINVQAVNKTKNIADILIKKNHEK